MKVNPQPMLTMEVVRAAQARMQAAAWADLHAERGPGRTIKIMHEDGTQSDVLLNTGIIIDGECEEVPIEPKRLARPSNG